jgi:hypothetical protein
VHTTATGRYRVSISHAGRYRVRSRTIAGPAVWVR